MAEADPRERPPLTHNYRTSSLLLVRMFAPFDVLIADN
jgi:hypothetical protein